MKEKIIILDTTLRDGEQAPGCSMSIEHKIMLARQLEMLEVDIIEAGFPISSKQQFTACQEISKIIKKSTIVVLARANKNDIDVAYESIKFAKKKKIHTFIAASPIHLKHKLNKTPNEILKITDVAIRHAKNYVQEIEFSAEDATRSEFPFLIELVNTAIEAGATTINIPDTVGFCTPQEYSMLLNNVITKCKKKDIIFSVHCHNDLGLALANSLAGIEAGARQVEVTINGIGERAGNASLAEIIVILNFKKDIYKNLFTSVKQQYLYEASQLLAIATGVNTSYNKPIVGRYVFSHEAGIHQHGFIKNRETYEIIDSKSVGRNTTTNLVLGRHSGQYGVKKVLAQLKIKLSEEEFEKFYPFFTEEADTKKMMFEDDIIKIVQKIIPFKSNNYELIKLNITTNSLNNITAWVQLMYKDKEIKSSAESNIDEMDALFQAINKATGNKLPIKDYELTLQDLSPYGKANVELTLKGANNKKIVGSSLNRNIFIATAQAYLRAINKK